MIVLVDKVTLFCYFLSASILIPVGIYLKSNYSLQVGEFILSGGGFFY